MAGMNDQLMLLRHRLHSAIGSGAVSPTDRLEDCEPILSKIFDTLDSLDMVELGMALEEKGNTKIRTMADLMRVLDEITNSPEE